MVSYLPLAEKEGDRLIFLDRFKGLAIFMVVATHALAYSQLPPPQRAFLSFIVQSVAVPAFFLVDGFLFAYKYGLDREFHLDRFLARSAMRLILPWSLFSVFYAAMRWGFEWAGFAHELIVYQRSFSDIVSAIYLSSISNQMYFLPALFLIRITSPIIRSIVKWPRLVQVSLVAAYVLSFEILDVRALFLSGFDPILQAIWGFQFYLLGVAMHSCREKVQQNVRALVIGGGMAVVALKIAPYDLAPLVQHIYLISLYSLFFWHPGGNDLCAKVGRHTMGIYLLHIPVVMRAASAVAALVLSESTVAYYSVVVVLSFIGSMFLTRCIMRWPIGHAIFGEG